MTSPNSRVERISFSPPIKLLTLGKAEQFTIEGKPDNSILRPQRLVCSSPCEKFVFITRIAIGGQTQLKAAEGEADSFDLLVISRIINEHGAIPFRPSCAPGFHTLSSAAGIECDFIYTGLVPKSFERGHDYHWKISALGPGILFAPPGMTEMPSY